MESILSTLNTLLMDLVNPQKRVFFGYLCVAFLIAVFVIYHRSGRKFSVSRCCRSVLSPKIWFDKSSVADFKLILFNRLIFGGIFLRIFSKSAVGIAVYFFCLEQTWFPSGMQYKLPTFFPPILFTVVLFIIDDYSRYWTHRLMHMIPALWELHKVHHSATVMTPFTVFRTHPAEALIFSTRGALVQGSVVGLCFALFGTELSLLTIMGANAASVIFHAVGSNLRHSHVPFRYPEWLESWLISPVQHQIHHSLDPKHYDKNFGVAFACWDRIHGSLCYSDSNKLRFGLSIDDKKINLTHGLVPLLVIPLMNILKIQRLKPTGARSSELISGDPIKQGLS